MQGAGRISSLADKGYILPNTLLSKLSDGYPCWRVFFLSLSLSMDNTPMFPCSVGCHLIFWTFAALESIQRPLSFFLFTTMQRLYVSQDAAILCCNVMLRYALCEGSGAWDWYPLSSPLFHRCSVAMSGNCLLVYSFYLSVCV